MAKQATRTKIPVRSQSFDSVALVTDVLAWYNLSGRQQLEDAMEVVGRDRVRLQRSLEVNPKTLDEAITF